MMLDGNVCSRIAPKLVSALGRFASAAVRSSRMPSPGLTRLTAANPRNSAAVVTISKYTIAFIPMRPIVRTLPVLAMPATSVPNSKRGNDRLHEPKKCRAYRSELHSEPGRGYAKQDTGGHPDENPGCQRQPLHRSPQLNFSRSTSKNIIRGGRMRYTYFSDR